MTLTCLLHLVLDGDLERHQLRGGREALPRGRQRLQALSAASPLRCRRRQRHEVKVKAKNEKSVFVYDNGLMVLLKWCAAVCVQARGVRVRARRDGRVVGRRARRAG